MKLINIHDLPDLGVSHNAKIRKRVMLTDGEVGAITTYARAVFPPGEKVGAHQHDDMAEVFTVESGRGEIRINDVAYVFSAGAVAVVEPGETHEIINTGTTDLIITYFGLLTE